MRNKRKRRRRTRIRRIHQKVPKYILLKENLKKKKRGESKLSR